MSEEPATRHFTPAELASFLDELELAHPPSHAGSGVLPLPLGLSPSGRPTISASGERQGTLQLVGLPPKTRPRLALHRARPRAVGLALLVGGGVLAGFLVLSPFGSPVAAMVRAHPAARASAARRARMRVPPALPTPPMPSLAPAQKAACPLPAGAAGPATGQSLAGSKALELAASEPGAAHALGLPAAEPVRDTHIASGARVPARPTLDQTLRREAVELVLAGRTREAVDAYRALPLSVRTPAVGEVVRYLERELEACGGRAGTSCSAR